MRSAQLRELLNAAATFAPGADLVVVGSQAILGWFEDVELPGTTTFSREADVYVTDDPDEERTTLLDRILGELTAYDAQHEVYLQGVDASTARLPREWRARSKKWPLSGGGSATFPEPHDLAVSKLAADRPKDREYVGSLLDAGLLDIGVLRTRSTEVDLEPIIRRRIQRFLAAW